MRASVVKWYTQETIKGETISEKDPGSLFGHPSPLSGIHFLKTIQPKYTRDEDVTFRRDSSEATEDRNQKELKIGDDV